MMKRLIRFGEVIMVKTWKGFIVRLLPNSFEVEDYKSRKADQMAFFQAVGLKKVMKIILKSSQRLQFSR